MGYKKGEREYTLGEKITIAEAICNSYKNGHPIVQCCEVAGIAYKTFSNWKVAHTEINDMYQAMLSEKKETKINTLVNLARTALEENLMGAEEIETVIIEGEKKVRQRDGSVKYEPDNKTITKITKKAKSMVAAKMVLEKHDPEFIKEPEPEEPETENEEAQNEREKWLLSKIAELQEKLKAK